MKKLLFVISLFVFNSAYADNSLISAKNFAGQVYKDSTVVNNAKLLLETKGSTANLCTYTSTDKVKMTPISVRHPSGGKYMSFLVTEDYKCSSETGFTDVYTLTTVVKIGQTITTGPHGSLLFQSSLLSVNVVELDQKIEDLEEGVSLDFSMD